MGGISAVRLAVPQRQHHDPPWAGQRAVRPEPERLLQLAQIHRPGAAGAGAGTVDLAQDHALPDWAPTLSPAERAISHRNEMLLYSCMFLLPISGYLFVMAGGYGIKLFGVYMLPDPIGKQAWLAALARLLHILAGYAAVVFIAWHVGLGLKHHLFDRDRFLYRMLPFRRQ
ncbi:MAG: cytochrome b/b6 domain-containing protein [Candidatus Competibacteraceae bacterium]